MNEYQLILCTCPDQLTAGQIAQLLVEEELAACVNITPQFTSVYRWQGKVETANEYLLIIKSSAVLYSQLEKRLKELHPYEIPEIIAIPIQQGSSDYLRWIDHSLRK